MSRICIRKSFEFHNILSFKKFEDEWICILGHLYCLAIYLAFIGLRYEQWSGRVFQDCYNAFYYYRLLLPRWCHHTIRCHYCVAGSNEPTPCLAGSFSYNTGNIDPTNCVPLGTIVQVLAESTDLVLWDLIVLRVKTPWLLPTTCVQPVLEVLEHVTVSNWGLLRQHRTNRLLDLSCWKVRRTVVYF